MSKYKSTLEKAVEFLDIKLESLRFLPASTLTAGQIDSLRELSKQVVDEYWKEKERR